MIEAASDEGTRVIRAGVGRSWADLFFYALVGAFGLGFLAVIGWGVFKAFGYVPVWVPVAALSSIIFVPWMMERAKDDARLFVVVDGPMRMTEYRIGKRVPISIEGLGITFKSKSGVDRVVLTDFDSETLQGRGSHLEGMTQFDAVRELSVVERLSSALEETLREDRLTMQHVGIEVEKKSREVVDWALRLIYEGTVPTEITDALGISELEDADMSLSTDLGDVLDG